MLTNRTRWSTYAWLMAFAGALFALPGCGLNEVEIPDLVGPAELGLSVTLTASPDILTADGFSTSLIQATVRDQNGRPAVGRQIFFAVADESGRFADIGQLRATDSTNIGTGIVVTTNAQGVALGVYQAPARTDATANQTVQVRVRPVGTDANAAFYRYVRIELRSAESRLFPQNPDNQPPTCNFTIEFPNGLRPNVDILFQSTSFDSDGTIIRYFWDFGNGTRADHPDVSTKYAFAGNYVVFHKVTDDDGAEDACTATIPIR
jgi:PKD domain-containing protein